MRAFFIILLLGLTEYIFAENYNTKLKVLQSFINKNQRYNNDIPADTIIAWSEQLEPILLKNNRYKELFEVKYIIAQTYAMHGYISLAIDKAHFMFEEAQKLNYEPGFALASQAIGDTYIYSSMLQEATPFYKQALEILNSQPRMKILKKRLLTRLLLIYLPEDNIEEIHQYLTLFNNLLPEEDVEDPLYIYRLLFNAAYYIKLGLQQEAGSYFSQIKEYAAQHTDMPLPYLMYVSASYYEKLNNIEAALAEYKQLYSVLTSEFGPIGQNHVIMNYAALLVKAGRADEACKLYRNINQQKDSLSIKSYTHQANYLYANYQVDTMELNNQTEKNNLIRMATFVGGAILFLSFLLASYIRRGNKKLAISKENLKEAKRRTEASIRSKSIFLSDMSHEIRTPLNALSGFSAILTEEFTDNETRLQCTEIIQQNSELLLKLINDVIDLSGLGFGKMLFNFKDCDAIVLCRNVIEMVQKIKQTKADILFDTSLERLVLQTDDARLQQVLINLLINGTKFTPSGSITLELSMQSENMAMFTVTDTGCGIPLENQKKIFQRFEKLDEQDQGTGLGLSICQLIIKHIGGNIWIDPGYTGGSRFCFTHPVRNVSNT